MAFWSTGYSLLVLSFSSPGRFNWLCRFVWNNLNNISNYQSRIQIIDYLDPSYILNCTDAVEKIREILDKHSTLPSSNGWSLLHSAVLLRDKELVKELLLAYKGSGDGNNNIYTECLQSSLELATALHHREIIELFRNESRLSMSPSTASRLVDLCLLSQNGIKMFDHPVEALTSSKDCIAGANPNARNDISGGLHFCTVLSSRFQSCKLCSNVMCHDEFAFEVQVVKVWRLLLEAKARAKCQRRMGQVTSSFTLEVFARRRNSRLANVLQMVCNGVLRSCRSMDLKSTLEMPRGKHTITLVGEADERGN
ncbi:hypothetical protein OS493_000183 [Desmophyllum pertusum]|uniref:Uncharacterized protein n=1 Tax=Desmophyllum pertusum TaxID=174260 RepID=A0A9X0DCA0_9CNID|nr:hypothetical protein OS493_000183 [Desmophyllum pertusum]